MKRWHLGGVGDNVNDLRNAPNQSAAWMALGVGRMLEPERSLEGIGGGKDAGVCPAVSL